MAKKYIDADRSKEVLKELESVIYSKQLVGQSMHQYDNGQLHAIKFIKELIDSLQQEQPEKKVEKVCGTCTYWQEGTLDRGQCQAEEPHQTHSAETCDRWERNEEIPLEEQPSKDLEEEISRTYHDGSVADTDDIDHIDYENIARHFAEWGAKHAKKGGMRNG